MNDPSGGTRESSMDSTSVSVSTPDGPEWLDEVAWNADGLAPAIAQDAKTGDVLMMAWMNRLSLKYTAEQRQAVYWSRSRARLWRKGESSGHVQLVREIRLDCDADTILLKVEQIGGMACHTGRANCFYRKFIWNTAVIM